MRAIPVLLFLSTGLAQNRHDTTCVTVPVSGDNAASLAKDLDKITPRINVRALGEATLVVCGPATDEPTLKALAAAAQKEAKSLPAPTQTESHSMRLFFLRDATSVAAALSEIYTGIKVAAVGKDMIVFKTSSPADESKIKEIKRWVALMDTARPEVALNAWSVQVSGNDPKLVDKEADRVRERVAEYNDKLQQAIGRGWSYLATRTTHNYTPSLRPYLEKAYVGLPNGPKTIHQAGLYSYNDAAACGPNRYCLGYGGSMNPVRRSLGSLLLAVATESNSAALAGEFVNQMEDRAAPPAPNDTNCEFADRERFDKEKKPAFFCLRRQLNISFGNPLQLAAFRRAIADFLFQYKFAIHYPHDFDSFDRTASAQILDAQLDPILVELNRDLTVFLQQIQTGLKGNQGEGTKIEFLSSGIVRVRGVSGTQAVVNTTTQSALPQTPAPLANDFVRQLAGQTSVPDLLTSNLGTNGGAAVAAFLASSQPVKVALGRHLNLTVTTNSLQGASAAELDVALDSGDEAAPQKVLADDTTKAAVFNRVASHHIETKVRVDSMKLFDVSSLSAEVRRSREGIPLLPPFLELPYIGNFLRFPMPPSRAFHRSVAIVNAVIVPTAAELAITLAFRHDLNARVLAENLKFEATLAGGVKATTGHPYYYWLVIKDGTTPRGVAGPVPVLRPDGGGPVTISWSPQPIGIAIDVLRTNTDKLPVSCTDCVVAGNVQQTSIQDSFGTPGNLEPQRLPVIFDPIVKSKDIHRNVFAFHGAMLKCIEKEAMGIVPSQWCVAPTFDDPIY